MATAVKRDFAWDAGEVDIQYLETLIEKASRKTDSPMIVDWLPHVEGLVEALKNLRFEYEQLWGDYELMRVERRKKQ